MTPDYIDELAEALLWTTLPIQEGLRLLGEDPVSDEKLEMLEKDLEAVCEIVRCPACREWTYVDDMTSKGDCGCQEI